MDIKRKYVDLIQQEIQNVYDKEADKIRKVGKMFVDCMDRNGVVQLFGVRHGEEFVNELSYRAGGIAQLHGLKFRNLVLKEKIKQEDVDSGAIYSDCSVIDKFAQVFDLRDEDMLVLVSYYGNEKLVIEMAKQANAKGQKVVALINKASYDKTGSNLLDYCDEYLDMNSPEQDIALHIGDLAVGQFSSTVSNVIAQMLTAEMYHAYKESGREAPVLLSANIKGADVHNNALTDPFGRRIR